jgi:hypothetical protein
MSNLKPSERPTPPSEALANTLASSVRCAIKAGLKLHDINGHAEEWVRHLRDVNGRRPSTDDFFAEWTRQLSELSKQPAEIIDDE